MSNSINQNDSTDIEVRSTSEFTQNDRAILSSYEAVVDGLAILIGPYCEIVLHSLEDLQHLAIRISHGEHTGRSLGSPITDLALQNLHELDKSRDKTPRVYFTRGKNGALMKSMTIAIRNPAEQIIGLLCINLNLDVPFSQVISAFMPLETHSAVDVQFANSVDELVQQALEQTIAEVSKDHRITNNAKNRQVVLHLLEKGIFDIKDAINHVAKRLNISKHTVYLYIRQSRHGDIGSNDF